VGLLGFALGLLSDVVLLKRVFTPIMGLGILHGVAFFSARLWRGGPGEPVGARAGETSTV
jgi:hypothetical protein